MGSNATPAGCAAVASRLGMAGAAISLAGRPLAASDEPTAIVEDRQYVLGEGPLLDAFAHRSAIAVDDVEHRGVLVWPLLGGALRDAGFRAAFAYPMMVGAACLGALTLYGGRPGALSAAQRAGAWAAVGAAAIETAVEVVVATEAHEVDDAPEQPGLRRVDRLQRAIGVVMGQLHLGADDAAARLRLHAYLFDRRLEDVVSDVLGGRLQLARSSRSATSSRPPTDP